MGESIQKILDRQTECTGKIPGKPTQDAGQKIKKITASPIHFSIYLLHNTMEEIVKIAEIRNVTHDVRSYRIAKPDNYRFEPGQATAACIHTAKCNIVRRRICLTAL